MSMDPGEVKKSDFWEKSDFCGRSSSWGFVTSPYSLTPIPYPLLAVE